MLNTLDTVIAFAVIMTVLSLLITLVVQMVSATLSLRGKNLANALALTFQTIDPTMGKYAHSLAAQSYAIRFSAIRFGRKRREIWTRTHRSLLPLRGSFVMPNCAGR